MTVFAEQFFLLAVVVKRKEVRHMPMRYAAGQIERSQSQNRRRSGLVLVLIWNWAITFRRPKCVWLGEIVIIYCSWFAVGARCFFFSFIHSFGRRMEVLGGESAERKHRGDFTQPAKPNLITFFSIFVLMFEGQQEFMAVFSDDLLTSKFTWTSFKSYSLTVEKRLR